MEARMKKNRLFSLALSLFLLAGLALSTPAVAQDQKSQPSDERLILDAMHGISSHTLLGYVQELVSEKYGGRLTGTKEFNECSEWAAGLFKSWGVGPAGENGTYFESFPNPYTLVFPDGEVSLTLPLAKSKDVIVKSYRYEDEFIPGSTSGNGQVTAEVVYVGYGVTAPELHYDDYRGVDVKGKIVLMEREVPVSPDRDAILFKKWRPYSFHQYKLKNAAAHGAKGMLYNYGPIGNPNNAYIEDFIYAHVGDAVVKDIFAGTGLDHDEVVKGIEKTLSPRSFATGKVFTIRIKTEHHPEGVGRNVLARIEGVDPKLKDEVIILGAHLDHLGRCWALMPGANDNASSVAVELGVAKAMAGCAVKPKRSIVFILFGAEEQAVAGSDYYVNTKPLFPLDQTVCYINMETAGSGDKLSVLAGDNFPALRAFLDKANQAYIHRVLASSFFANLGRPRQDVTWFLWKGVPGVTVSSFGFDAGRPTYHTPHDNLDFITPEIMEDLAQLLFMAIMDMSDEPTLNFRTK
jgi:hypothetical protein